jgi:membrane associated rhomboid family serine protease
MNQKSYVRMMLVLTVLFGVLVGALAILGSGGVGVVAAIGGIIIGLGWAFTGMLPGKRDRTS